MGTVPIAHFFTILRGVVVHRFFLQFFVVASSRSVHRGPQPRGTAPRGTTPQETAPQVKNFVCERNFRYAKNPTCENKNHITEILPKSIHKRIFESILTNFSPKSPRLKCSKPMTSTGGRRNRRNTCRKCNGNRLSRHNRRNTRNTYSTRNTRSARNRPSSTSATAHQQPPPAAHYQRVTGNHLFTNRWTTRANLR